MTAVMVLLDQAPLTARKKTRYGEVALHVAASADRANSEHACAICKALLSAYPEAQREKEWDGFTPLHLALKYQMNELSAALATLLLVAYPAGATQKSTIGELPLHLAACHLRGEPAVAVVALLLRVNPEGTRQRVECGKLPLHVAAACQSCEHGARVVTLLLEAYPRGQCTNPIGLLIKCRPTFPKSKTCFLTGVLRCCVVQPRATGRQSHHLNLNNKSHSNSITTPYVH